jgi:hypothetical protein
MTTLLRVATPEGDSGRILSTGGDYLFRYREEADTRAAISLLMPVRLDEYRHRELHPIFQMNQGHFSHLVDRYILRAGISGLQPKVLARSTELCEQAPNVVVAIKQCAEPFMKNFA